MIDWAGYLQLMLAGALLTVELTVAGAVVAFIMAMAAGLGRMSRHCAVRAIATADIEFLI